LHKASMFKSIGLKGLPLLGEGVNPVIN